MKYAIEVKDLHKKYQDTHALKGINLIIPQGAFFGLLGPNGAGKSTLINIIAGLIKASSGEAKVLGKDVNKDYLFTRRNLGIVPQELVYDPFFKVIEFLKIQAGYFGLGKENYAWLDELVDNLGLQDKKNAPLMALSGGMKRRVLIAQALVHKPQVVILDEPTAGVDVELRSMLWDFIKKLHQQGHTIVLTTHYLEEAEALCQDIAILRQGEIAVQEPTETLLARYPYRFLQIVLAITPDVIPDKIQRLLDSQMDNILRLKIHREKDSIGEILELLQQCKIQILDLKTEEPTLEDVFLTLVH